MVDARGNMRDSDRLKKGGARRENGRMGARMSYESTFGVTNGRNVVDVYSNSSAAMFRGERGRGEKTTRFVGVES